MAENSTVADLKGFIQLKTGISSESLRVMYSGRCLKGDLRFVPVCLRALIRGHPFLAVAFIAI
jgi:hypothetical protein